jgi:sensor domain CHASE-containing protein
VRQCGDCSAKEQAGWLRRGTQPGALLAALVLTVGTVGSMVTAYALREAEKRTAEQMMERRTISAQETLEAEVARYLGLAQTVTAAVASHPDLTAAQRVALSIAILTSYRCYGDRSQSRSICRTRRVPFTASSV